MIEIILLGLALSAIHFFSESYGEKTEKYHSEFISLSSGLFITFIFLYLLPELTELVSGAGQGIYLFLLLGFVSFHILEKYIYQHIQNKDKLLTDLAGLHVFGFFLDHFVLGMAFFFVFSLGGASAGLVVFLLLLFHTISSAISLNHIDRHFNQKLPINLFLSSSPLIGILFAFLINPTGYLYAAIFSFAVGAIIYIVIRDMLPYGKEGKPWYFILGLVISLAVLFLLSPLTG